MNDLNLGVVTKASHKQIHAPGSPAGKSWARHGGNAIVGWGRTDERGVLPWNQGPAIPGSTMGVGGIIPYAAEDSATTSRDGCHRHHIDMLGAIGDRGRGTRERE